MDAAYTTPEKKRLNCDQVSWLMAVLERLQRSTLNLPKISKMPEATQLASLLEIMDVLGYEFEDNAAAGNAISRFTEFNGLRDLDVYQEGTTANGKGI